MKILHKTKPCAKSGGGKPAHRPGVTLVGADDADSRRGHPGDPNRDKAPPAPGEAHFLVSECRGLTITENVFAASHIPSFDPTDVDCHIDEAFGPISIRQQDGSFRPFVGRIPLLGPIGRALLDDLMRAPGQFLDANDLARNPFLRGMLDPQTRAQAMRRLRKAFAEDARFPWYFQVVGNPWRAQWLAERTWRIIEPLAE